jgi:hypothetical protein
MKSAEAYRQESETQVVAHHSGFTSTTASFNLPATGLPRGWYQARVVVNGIPSGARMIRVD